MAKPLQVSWHVLLDDENWDQSAEGHAVYADLLPDPSRNRSTRKHVIQSLGLFCVLLLLSGYVFWESVQAVPRPAGPSFSQPPPISADRLATTAHRLILTENLRISASGVDIAVVMVATMEMESLYRQLFEAVGLPLVHGQTAPDGRIFVRVTGTGAPDWDARRGYVTLPSPSRLSLPAENDRKTALLQGWALALIDQVVRETGTAHQIPPQWLPLLSALRLWLVQEAGGPLSAGWKDVTSRLYGVENGHLTSAQVESLCAEYAAWDFSSLDFAIPLGCSPAGGSVPHHHPPGLELAGLGLPAWDENETIHTLSTVRRLALALCLSYAVETFGRDKMPLLLAGLGRHNSWDTLIPEVFGTGTAQFEAGCRLWARERQ